MLIDHSAYIYLSSDSVVYGANQKHDNADVSDIITLYCFVAVSDHRRYFDYFRNCSSVVDFFEAEACVFCTDGFYLAFFSFAIARAAVQIVVEALEGKSSLYLQ